jgi:hypothetical protein
MKIGFLDFWHDFDINNNFFYHMMSSIIKDVRVTRPEDCDLLFFSCYGSRNNESQFQNKKRIFYTGENLRPVFDNRPTTTYNTFTGRCDLSISFDFDDYNGRNIRLPLWYIYIDWFNVKSYNNPNWLIPLEYLSNDNEFTKKEKKQFCSTVFSSPYDSRFNMVNLLNNYKQVDCYGKIHNNKLPDGEKYKMDVISNYKFNICFENSLYPGYFTEKLLHAKIAGCIPIYYSDKSYSTDFNTKCCINLIDFENEYELIEYIKKVDSDSSLYRRIQREPLFDKIPDLNNFIEKIKKII